MKEKSEKMDFEFNRYFARFCFLSPYIKESSHFSTFFSHLRLLGKSHIESLLPRKKEWKNVSVELLLSFLDQSLYLRYFESFCNISGINQSVAMKAKVGLPPFLSSLNEEGSKFPSQLIPQFKEIICFRLKIRDSFFLHAWFTLVERSNEKENERTTSPSRATDERRRASSTASSSRSATYEWTKGSHLFHDQTEWP